MALDFSAVRALIFDLDGTLIDSKQDLIRSVNAMLAKMGREQLHEDTISGYIGHGAPKLVARALGNGAEEAECRPAPLQWTGPPGTCKCQARCCIETVARS